MQRKTFLILILLAAVLGTIASATTADRLTQIDHLMQTSIKSNEPGAVLEITQNGKPLLRKAYGMADLEEGVAMQPDMVFRIGSMTKQFTATSILILQQEGKLSIHDDITKYLPDFPTHGKTITIENLLTHTSGIKSYTELPEWLPLWRKDMSLQELIALFKDQPMDFDPGSDWRYDNSGYILLGAIIEKVSGESYETFLQKRIFDPLGMKHTYYGSASRVIPRRIPGYSKGDNGYVNCAYLSMTQPYAAGSLLSTVDDLALWDHALYGESPAAQDLLHQAWTSHILPDGRDTHYGFGWGVATFQGQPAITHGGGINGFASNGIRLPQEHLYFVLLSNNESLDTDMLNMKIAGILIGQPLKDPVAVPRAPETLKQFVGVYQIDEKNERLITEQNGKLFTQRTGGQRYELTPSSGSEFFMAEPELVRFRFLTDASGAVTAMQRFDPIPFGPDDIAKKTDKPLPKSREAIAIKPEVFDRYVGKYELAPDVLLTVSREGEHFYAQITGDSKLEIFAESEKVFFPKEIDATLEFVEDQGKIIAVKLIQGGQTINARRL